MLFTKPSELSRFDRNFNRCVYVGFTAAAAAFVLLVAQNEQLETDLEAEAQQQIPEFHSILSPLLTGDNGDVKSAEIRLEDKSTCDVTYRLSGEGFWELVPNKLDLIDTTECR